MKLTPFLILCLLSTVTSAKDKPAYKVFTGEGKKAVYQDILKSASTSDVVFFGELHDNPIAHWLELELTKDLFDIKGKNLILAAEMFETDNQMIIDEYFKGVIKESSFENELRKWKNYSTDYKPLLNFAREKELRLIASNIPRRYASVVSAKGFEGLEALTPEALKYIAPLPLEYDPELPCYKDMLSMDQGPMGHTSDNLPKAQAIKDATMAKSIADNWQPGRILIHFNGSYHSDRYMGIIWYLNKYKQGVKILTIKTVVQDNIDKLNSEESKTADFVIVIPSSMTTTY